MASVEQLQSEVIRQEGLVQQALRERDTWQRLAISRGQQLDAALQQSKALTAFLQPTAVQLDLVGGYQ